MMNKKLLLLIVAGGGGAAYWWWKSRGQTTVAQSQQGPSLSDPNSAGLGFAGSGGSLASFLDAQSIAHGQTPTPGGQPLASNNASLSNPNAAKPAHAVTAAQRSAPPKGGGLSSPRLSQEQAAQARQAVKDKAAQAKADQAAKVQAQHLAQAQKAEAARQRIEQLKQEAALRAAKK